MTQRTVVTTGANSGIGLATALELARRGHRSVATVRSTAKAELVHEAAASVGVEVEVRMLDVTDPAGCERLFDGLEPFALVNNAGYAVTGAIEDVSDDEARALFETMVLAPMRLSRLALPAMRSLGEGRIINVSSIMGRVSAPLSGWYAAAKHSLETLSDALRMEVASDGVKVVLVEPGGFKTGIWDEFRRDIERLDSQGSPRVSVYERFLRLQQLSEPLMGDPGHCGRVIGDIVDSRRPRERYLVGIDAQLLNAASRLTPTPIQDRVVRLALGL